MKSNLIFIHCIIFLRSLDDAPSDWITIDEDSGVLKVKADREIGCDVPVRNDLTFKVKLFDGENETFGTVSRNFESFRYYLLKILNLVYVRSKLTLLMSTTKFLKLMLLKQLLRFMRMQRRVTSYSKSLPSTWTEIHLII